MENRRSPSSGSFDVGSSHDYTPQTERHGPSSISLTAAFAVGTLLIVMLWGATRESSAIASNAISTEPKNVASAGSALPPLGETQNASTPADLSSFAPQVVGVIASQYEALQQHGGYTPQAGAALAQQVAPAIKAPVSYRAFTLADLSVSPDTSYTRMQRYQSDLRQALAPLSKNTTPEISLFAAYSQTHDETYLAQLRKVAQEYADALAAAQKIEVPQDAAAIHIGILNAMGQFGATLQALADYAPDPVTTVGLLSTYNDAEQDMVVSFNALASYVAHHSRP